MLPTDILTVEDIDGSRGMTINELPVNSAICEPAAHARITSGLRRLRGWAAASGRDVSRVDVSADGGWRMADERGDRPIWTAIDPLGAGFFGAPTSPSTAANTS